MTAVQKSYTTLKSDLALLQQWKTYNGQVGLNLSHIQVFIFQCTPCLFLMYLNGLCACLLHGTAARFTLNFLTLFTCDWPNLMHCRKLFYKPQLLTPAFYKLSQVYCQFKDEAKTLMLRKKGYKNIPFFFILPEARCLMASIFDLVRSSIRCHILKKSILEFCHKLVRDLFQEPYFKNFYEIYKNKII